MIIFDMDGTLWNTTNITLESANLVALKYDDVKPFTVDIIENGMGLSFKENVRNYFPYLDKDTGSKYLNEIISNTIKLINEKDTYIYDGVIDTIKKLSKNYKLAIVTNNNTDYVELFLNKSGLNDYFVDYLGAATYNISKSDAIKVIINRNNEENCFYVGDTKRDKDASKEAKCTFIHARYGFDKSLESKYHIDSINEIEEIIKKIK